MSDAKWLIVDNRNATISGIPTNDDVGKYWVNVTVKDDRGGRNWSNFTLTVLNVNDPPVIITENSISTLQDVLYTVKYEAMDIDPTDDVMSWSVSTDAQWISMNSTTGVLSGIPTNEFIGNWFVNIEVEDGNGGRDSTHFMLEVVNVNDDPIIPVIPIKFAVENIEYIQQMDCYDIDPTNDTISIDFKTDAPFLSYSRELDIISGTPRNEHVGTYWVNYSASDDKGGSAFLNYTLTVLNSNDGPIIMTKDVLTAVEDMEYRVAYKAIDMDPTDDTLLWRMMTNASFLSMGSEDGVLIGTPTNDDVGRWWVNVSVSDGEFSDWRNFTLTVVNTNDPPTARYGTYLVNMDEDTLFELDLDNVFLDIDGDRLTYSATSTGNISLTVSGNILRIAPFRNWAGSASVTVRATDSELWANGSVSITVNNVNDAPFGLVVDRRELYREGTEQPISANASDPDIIYGDSLNFTWRCDGRTIGYGPTIDMALEKGSYIMNVTVTDSEGANISMEFIIKVLSNKGRSRVPLELVLIAVLASVVIFTFVMLVRSSRKEEVLPPIPIPVPEERTSLEIGTGPNTRDLSLVVQETTGTEMSAPPTLEE